MPFKIYQVRLIHSVRLLWQPLKYAYFERYSAQIVARADFFTQIYFWQPLPAIRTCIVFGDCVIQARNFSDLKIEIVGLVCDIWPTFEYLMAE